MKTFNRHALLLLGLVALISPRPGWTQNLGPHRAVEVCLEGEAELQKKGALADALIAVKLSCLKPEYTLREFYQIAQPSCGERCPENYAEKLEGFIVRYVGDYAFPGDSVLDFNRLTCLVRTPAKKFLMLEAGLKLLRSEADWKVLKEPAFCPRQTPTLEYYRAFTSFEKQYAEEARRRIARKAPDSPRGAAGSIVEALAELKKDFSPLYTPTFSALQASAADYESHLSLGEQVPEVRARSHLVVLFESYVQSFCKVWNTSRFFQPICTGILEPITFLKKTFPPDLAVNTAMEVRVTIATLDSLKRRIQSTDWATYVEPMDLALRKLEVQAVANGDANPATITQIQVLRDTVEHRPPGAEFTPLDWLARQMTPTDDPDRKIAAEETYRRILIIINSARN